MAGLRRLLFHISLFLSTCISEIATSGTNPALVSLDANAQSGFSTMSPIAVTESTVPFVVNGEEFLTYYKVYGSLSNSTRPPLIVIHGGPGFTHTYLAPLADIAEKDDRAVVFYDQLGNGGSTRLRDKPVEFFSVRLYVDELANLIEKLGIKEYHILGHSWGGPLAAEFEVQVQPSGLKSLVITNALASMKDADRSFDERIASLDNADEVRAGFEAGYSNPKALRAALSSLYKEYGVRYMKEMPKELQILDVVFGDEETGEGGDWTVNVQMKDCTENWTITDRLHLVRVPTLLISGHDDFLQDYCQEPYFWGIPGKVKWTRFDKSSHVPMWEEREEYMNTVSAWMGRVELETIA